MVSVYIISEVRSYRDALELALRSTARINVLGCAGHPVEALAEIGALEPEVILLDLPRPEGPAWAAELRSLLPGTRLIALSLAEAEHQVIAWAEAGVAGYVGCEASLTELVTAIEGAARGDATCSGRIAAILLRRISTGPETGVLALQLHPHVTSREGEILNLVGAMGGADSKLSRPSRTTDRTSVGGRSGAEP
jgi:DNA-binding NarL/FixJ family response regulator